MARHSTRKSYPGDRRAVALIWVAVSLVLIGGFAALAIDMSYLYVMKGRVQVTASAAALAGASQLPSNGRVTSTALAYARKNMAPAQHGAVLTGSDVVLGNWNTGTRTFTLEEPPSTL